MVIIKAIIYDLDRIREFKMGFKATTRLEEVLKRPSTQWDVKNFSSMDIAYILAESNKKEDPNITADQIMDLVDEFSDIKEAYIKAYQIINAAWGEKNDQEADQQSGIGKMSSETL